MGEEGIETMQVARGWALRPTTAARGPMARRAGLAMLVATALALGGCAGAGEDDMVTSAGGEGGGGGQSQGSGGGKGQGGGDTSSADAGSYQGGGAEQGSGGMPASPGGGGDTAPGAGSGGGGASEPDKGVPDNGGGGDGPDAGGTDAGGPEPVCNTKDPVVLYMSADDSNSMASATVARGLIGQGQLVYKPVRTYELLNYYDFPYPAAKTGEIAVSAQLRDVAAEAGQEPGSYALQIGVRAPDFDDKTRRRLNIVLSVDTSSSMGWGAKGKTGADLAQAACKALVGALDKGDRFALLTWGKVPQTLVAGTELASKDDGTLAAACELLGSDGDTGLSAGLAAAYAEVKQGFDAKRINRVVLISDGGANVGDTDAALVAAAAKDADAEAIYLMGVGVGDPWNYNDALMDALTDAGKGAYVFLDSTVEAWTLFGSALFRHVEVAARDVQVAVELPPGFAVQAFHGEQISTVKEEVEPQHLAANDDMIFHQIVRTCAPDALTGAELVRVKATWKHPLTKAETTTTFEAELSELLAGDKALLAKGDAVVAYAEALQDVQQLEGKAAEARIDLAIAVITKAVAALPGDADLPELAALLAEYRKVFGQGQATPWPKGGTGAGPIASTCGACDATGATLEALRCALDLCDDDVYLGATHTSPTQSKTAGTFAATDRFGAGDNHLAPRVGGSYALMATGPATGTNHSVDLGGTSMADPYLNGGKGGGAPAFNAVEWKLTLKAPPGAGGFRFRHVFFSQEYDEYVGSTFNDKFYVVIEAGSTNGKQKTVINYTECRDPTTHHDFVCSPGMQYCQPRQRYCYIAINTAMSECCWLGGCPNGKAKTDISGTGFSCAASQGSDNASTGSSTGWLMTEWPVEPGETFTLTFHLHDTGDGIYDSEVLLDGFEFVGSVTPGTWPLPPIM